MSEFLNQKYKFLKKIYKTFSRPIKNCSDVINRLPDNEVRIKG